jgi:hypothetical protein
LRTTAYVSHAVRGLRTVELENDWFWVTLLPEVGAKIYDLVWKPTGRNYLWHNPRIAPKMYPIDAISITTGAAAGMTRFPLATNAMSTVTISPIWES